MAVAAAVEVAVAAVMAEMRRIDAHFSPYIPTSELYRVNQLAPKASAQQPGRLVFPVRKPCATSSCRRPFAAWFPH